jgi:hypothetical protein
MEVLITNLLGFFIGLLTSFFSWWVLFHWIVPKLEFSKDISKFPADDDSSGYSYRIKFLNTGNRSLVDLQVVARLSIKGLTIPRNWFTIKIPLEWNGDLKAEFPKLSPKTNRIVRLFISHAASLKVSSHIPEHIRDKARLGKLTLEDLMALGSSSKLVIWVFGYDEFSGSRKLFKSYDYQSIDIKQGRFGRLEVTRGIDDSITE